MAVPRLLGSLCATLCVLGLLVVPGAAGAQRPQAPVLRKPVVGTKTVALTGTAPRTAVVRVQRRTTKRWVTFRTVRADRVGRFTVRIVRPATATRYRVAVAGKSVSTVRVVKPRRPALSKPLVGPKTVVLSGAAARRAPVRIQRRDAARWVTFRTVRANLKGAFTAQIARPASSTRYRAASAGGASTVRTVNVPTTAASTPSDACGPRPAKQDGGLWTCSFHDDFDGSSLDTDKWLMQETWFSGMTTGNADCYVNDDRTVAVRSGVLELSVRRGLDPFLCSSPYGNFMATGTASTVATRDRFTQTYGRFSFRVKFPGQAGVPGAHSAAWLYPQEHRYGIWPLSGEIDVAEWWSARPEKVYPSAHYLGEILFQSTGQDCAVPTASTAFHTYTVEWSRDQLSFSYDGKLCFTHRWSLITKTLQPFDHPFYLVLTQLWGTSWNKPTAASPRSATMKVDWVRAWR